MADPACSRSEFLELFEKYGPAETAKRLGVTVRNIYDRRRRMEARIGRQVTAPGDHYSKTRTGIQHPHRLEAEVKDGVVIIGSDLHAWPGLNPVAFRAFVRFCKELKPKLVIMNGDAFDGARISRHSPIGWEKRPEVIHELEAVQEKLGEIEEATARGVRLIWPLGNHDGRFETRLATVAPEFARVHGFHLKDHMGPRWEPCWSIWLNEDVVVKHRHRGGIHAARNNVIAGGKSIITGHLHSLKVSPISDYNGTRFGVDCGCLADPYGPQFTDYTEDGPLDWRSGFVVLTFHKGRLLWPEVVSKIDDDHVEFRGQVQRV